MKYGKVYRKYVKKSGTRKYARKVYKATGLVNPIKKGRISTTRLAKDVSILKGIINSEKFRLETQIPTTGNVAIGQVDGNSSGHFIADVTPYPSQGDGYNNRQGNSIRWKSSHYSFFFRRQSTAQGPCKIHIQFIKVIGEPYTTPSNILGRFIEPNRWISGGSIYDTASDRKPEYYRQFRVIRSKTYYFKNLDYANQPAQQKTVNIGFKLSNHHVKWNNNSNTLAQGQVLMLITMDTGNCSTSTVSTLDDIVNTGTSTGMIMNCNRVDYYYDN